VLAIAAAKLSGSGPITAYETDADSVSIAIDNAALNGVGPLIEFFHRPIGKDTHVFDFVCANLTIDVISPQLSLLIAKSRKTLVLSGILVEQQDLITTQLGRQGIQSYEIQRDGEWIAVIVSIN
jgi:ribosomal protein L11 methylase PrmA